MTIEHIPTNSLKEHHHAVILSNDEIERIIKALAYDREENGGDDELENDLKIVLKNNLSFL